MVPAGKSIAPRLALKLVAIVSLLLAVVAAVDFWSQYHQRHRRLSARATVTANQLSASLSLPLWNFQEDVVDRILDGAMESQEVAGIVIHQPNVASPGGMSTFARRRDARWKPIGGLPEPLQDGITEKRDIVYQGKTVGTLEFSITPRWIEAELRRGLAMFVGLAVLLDIILVAWLYALLRREIISPLQAIGKYAGQVSASGGEIVEMPRQRFGGELESLRSSLETTLKLLQSRYAEIGDSEELFRTSFESAAVGMCLVAADGRFLNANRALCEMLGYPKEELTRLKFTDVTYEEDKRVGADFLAGALSGGPATMRIEKRYVRKDGKVVWGYLSTALIERKRTGDRFLISYIQDITERRRANEALREAEGLYRGIFEGATEGIYRTSPEGRALAANPALARIFGFDSPEQLLAEAVDTPEMLWVSPDDRGRFVRRLEEEGQVRNYECQMRRRDGTAIWVVTSARRVAGTDARTAYYEGFISDISEKKRLEEQFLRVQRLESIGMLAAGIAHDLNNVLMPITMAVSLLRNKHVDPATLQILTMLDRSTERGAGLVRQILGFARGVRGDPYLLQAKHLVLDVIEMVTQTFPKSIVLEHSVPGDLWLVMANPTQLHQVLLNLCVNARDAMPQGGTLRLTAENRAFGPEKGAAPGPARPGPWLALRVEDTGTGMPPDVLARIWEPFFTTKGTDKGTGLGLTTVRGIVESLGGFIAVDTEPGRGTAFQVFLPASRSPSAKAEGGAAVARARGAGETILLVDDEQPIREMARPILENAGYAVVAAENGAQAIELFASRPEAFALVVTDVDMPVVDGPAFARQVKGIRPAIKILATSGLESRTAEVDWPGFADDFLLKPFVADTFLATVEKLLRVPVPTA